MVAIPKGIEMCVSVLAEWLDQFWRIVVNSEPLDDRLPVCGARGRYLNGNAKEARSVRLIKVNSDNECDDSLRPQA